MNASAPDDFIARRLLESGLFPQESLHQAWQISRSQGISFLAALERIANLPSAESTRLAALADQTWLQLQSAELAAPSAWLSPVAAPSAIRSGSIELQSPVLPSSGEGPGNEETPLELNPQVPGYEIHGELSRGGMGAVFRATHLESGRSVALKLILGANPGDRELRRFEYEARTLGGLAHPGLVALIDKGQFNGKPYLAMELVKGRTLKAIVLDSLSDSNKVPDLNWSSQILAQLATALNFCHKRGITHRDLKPENILIEEGTDRAVLIDFGLVKREKESLSQSLVELQDELTLSGAVAGTPAFMAPEQLDNVEGPPIGPHTDIWGFGATAYFLFTGEPPFGGASIVNLYKALLTKKPDPPKSLNPELPERLDDLVNACLERDIDRRPAAWEIGAALADKKISISRGTRRFLILSTLLIPLALLAAWLLRPQQRLRASIEMTFDRNGVVYLASLDRRPPELTLRLRVNSSENLTLSAMIGNTKLAPLNDKSGSYLLSIPTNIIPEEGDSVLKVAALDALGNKGSTSIAIKTDSEAPTLRVLRQVTPIAARPLELTGLVEDSASGAGRVALVALGDKARADRILAEVSLTANSFTLQAHDLPIGAHRLELRAEDRVGNTTTQPLFIIRRPCIAVGFKENQTWAQSSTPDIPTALSHELNRLEPSKHGADIILAAGIYELPETVLRTDSLRLRPFRPELSPTPLRQDSAPLKIRVHNTIALDNNNSENELRDIEFLVSKNFPTAAKILLLAAGGLIIDGCRFAPESLGPVLDPHSADFKSSLSDGASSYFEGRGIGLGSKGAEFKGGPSISIRNSTFLQCRDSAITNYLDRKIIIQNCLITQTQKKAIESHLGSIWLEKSIIDIALEQGIYLEEGAQINLMNVRVSNAHGDALRLTNGQARRVGWLYGEVLNCGSPLRDKGLIRPLPSTHTAIFIESGRAVLNNVLIDMQRRVSSLASVNGSNLSLINCKIRHARPALAISQDASARVLRCEFEHCGELLSSAEGDQPGKLQIDNASTATAGAEIPQDLRILNLSPDNHEIKVFVNED